MMDIDLNHQSVDDKWRLSHRNMLHHLGNMYDTLLRRYTLNVTGVERGLNKTIKERVREVERAARKAVGLAKFGVADLRREAGKAAPPLKHLEDVAREVDEVAGATVAGAETAVDSLGNETRKAE